MPITTTEVYLRGDQIATYGSVRTSGNSNGVKVTLSNVQPLGNANSYFRVVISHQSGTVASLSTATRIDVYAWPDPAPPDPPIYSNIVPNPNDFQGRATSGGHLIVNSRKLLFQVDPIVAGTVQIGPGVNPPRFEPLKLTSFPSTPPAIPCFAEGTLIRTARGELPVESIRPGERVLTADNGYQEVIWSSSRKVCGLGSMAPVRIEAGILGNRRRLLVSPQHRMLCSGWSAELLAGETEVFAAAAHLVNGKTIRRVRRPMITYVHLLCEHHEVIFAEGAATESLFPGGMSLSAFTKGAREEILDLFPRLCPRLGTGRGIARPVLPRGHARLIAA